MISKEDILEEIRKTTKENGGIPLGVDRFRDKTGITQTEWGKFWPRLGDAQREAGFEANIFNTAGYEKEYLYEKFIVLIRELKKWPVRGDQRVKRANDSNFPSDYSFYRLGTKQKLASKLLEYAQKKKYIDIVEICNTVLKEFDNKDESVEEQTRNEFISSVYLAKSGRYYKIGRTNSMGRRHHEINILLPENFTLVHEVRTDDPSGIEAYWHRRFESKRKNGEWFDLSSSDVKAFKRWKRII